MHVQGREQGGGDTRGVRMMTSRTIQQVNGATRFPRLAIVVAAALGVAGAADATLDAAVAVSATSVNVGSGTQVTLTVTNTGGGDALNIVPQLGLAGPATLSAPTPLSVTQLGAGDKATFTWTVSPNGGGTVALTLNAAADGPDPAPTRTASFAVPPPAFDVRLTTSKTTASVSQGVTITLSVTNTGGTAAPNVTAKL